LPNHRDDPTVVRVRVEPASLSPGLSALTVSDSFLKIRSKGHVTPRLRLGVAGWPGSGPAAAAHRGSVRPGPGPVRLAAGTASLSAPPAFPVEGMFEFQ
jgi:hypothetical protein